MFGCGLVGGVGGYCVPWLLIGFVAVVVVLICVCLRLVWFIVVVIVAGLLRCALLVEVCLWY